MGILREFELEDTDVLIGTIEVQGYGKFALLNINDYEYLLSDDMLDEYEKEYRFDRKYFINSLLDHILHRSYSLKDIPKMSIYDVICNIIEARPTLLDLTIIGAEISELQGRSYIHNDLNLLMLTLSKINLHYLKDIGRADLNIFKSALKERKITNYVIGRKSTCYITPVEY